MMPRAITASQDKPNKLTERHRDSTRATANT